MTYPLDLRRLRAARELLELALVRHALDALHLALRLEHPTVDELTALGDPLTLKRARTVLAVGAALRGAMHAYRAAVDSALASPNDDLPF